MVAQVTVIDAVEGLRLLDIDEDAVHLVQEIVPCAAEDRPLFGELLSFHEDFFDHRVKRPVGRFLYQLQPVNAFGMLQPFLPRLGASRPGHGIACPAGVFRGQGAARGHRFGTV